MGLHVADERFVLQETVYIECVQMVKDIMTQCSTYNCTFQPINWHNSFHRENQHNLHLPEPFHDSVHKQCCMIEHDFWLLLLTVSAGNRLWTKFGSRAMVKPWPVIVALNR